MSNETLIKTLVSKLSVKVEWAMKDLEMTYSEAKVFVSESSAAGPAVWAILDAKY